MELLSAEGHRYSLPVFGAVMSLGLFVVTLIKMLIGQSASASRAMLAAATGIMLAMTGGFVFALSPLAVGLCLILPLLALIVFGMLSVGSVWVLAALFLPWFGIGAAGVVLESTAKENAINVLALFVFVLSLGLIALGIYVAHSAWPLAAIAAGGAGACCGMLMGAAMKSDEKQESNVSENQELSQEKLQWAAWWIGLIGATRAWALLSTSSNTIDKLLAGESFSVTHQLLLQLTGPVLVSAGIAAYHGRFYWFAVAGAILCLPTGNLLPVILGIYSLIALFDPKVRALFLRC